MTERGRRASWALLALFLAAFAVWGIRNHRCSTSSDPGTYLRFAANLAAGRFFVDTPLDHVFDGRYPEKAVYLGTYSTIMHEGRGTALYAIGFPLYLALLIAVGGIYAPFFGNLLVFLALFALLAAGTHRMFAGHRAAPAAALAAPVLYWYFNRTQIDYFQAPYRDPLSHLLLLGAFVAALAHFRGGRRTGTLALAGLLAGGAVCVRETSVLGLLPLGLLWAADCVAARRLPRPRALLAFGIGLVAGVLPTLAQNAVSTGNPFYPTQLLHAQVYFGDLETMDEDRSVRMRSLSTDYFPETAPRLLALMLKDYDPLLLALLAAGLWAGRSAAAVRWLLVPLVAAATLFFGCYLKPMPRYIFVAQIALAPVAALGFAAAAAWVGDLLRAPRLPAAAAALLLVGASAALLAERQSGLFQVPQARAFARAFDAAVPAGSAVIVERPMNQLIDYLTGAHAAVADNFRRPEVGLTLAESIEHFERTLPGAFFLDSADTYLRDGFDSTPVTRELILERRDLERVAVFEAAAYGLGEHFGRRRAALHRIVPWREGPVERRLPAPPGGGGILRVNGRGLAPAAAGALSLDGRPVGGGLAGGVAWYAVPPGLGAGGEALLRVSGPGPLPRDLAPQWLAEGEPVPVDIGPNAVPLDWSFFESDHRYARWQGRPRILSGAAASPARSGLFAAGSWQGYSKVVVSEGAVRLPVVPRPGGHLVVAARIAPLADEGAGPVTVAFSGAGVEERFTLGQWPGWRTVTFPVEGPDPGGATARLRILPLTGAGGGRSALAVDRLVVHRLPGRRLPLEVGAGPDAEPYLAEGFHEAERDREARAFRWTDGAGRMRLPVAAEDAGRAATLALGVVGHQGGAAASLRISLNGRALCEHPLTAGGARTFPCAVPPGVLRAGWNDLEISSPRWSPARLHGSSDLRELGVMVEFLRLAAVSPGGAG